MAYNDDWTPYEEPTAAAAPAQDDWTPYEEPTAAAPAARDDWTPYQEPTAAAPAARDDWTPYIEPSAPTAAEPEAEGPVGTVLRKLAHNVLPTAAAIGTGVATAPASPFVAIPAAIGAFYATQKLQEEGLKAIGRSDADLMALNAKLNPKSDIAADVLSAAIPFGVGSKLALGQRAVGAVVGTGLEAAGQAMEGHFDPTRLAVAPVTGALFNAPRALTQRFEGAVGSRLGQATGRPDLWPAGAAAEKGKVQTPGTDTPGADASPGIAEPGIKAAEVKVDDQQIGVGSERDYPAVPRTDLPAKEPGFNVVESDPAIDLAIQRAVGGEAAPGAAYPRTEAEPAIGGEIRPPGEPISPLQTEAEPAAPPRAAAAPEPGIPPGLQGPQPGLRAVAERMKQERLVGPEPGEVSPAAAAVAGGAPPREPPLPPAGGAAAPPTPPTGPVAAAHEAIRSRIAQPTSGGKSWREHANEFYENWKDKFHPIKQAETAMAEGRTLATEESPYDLARLTAGTHDQVRTMLDHGTFDFNTRQKTGPGLKEILAPVDRDPGFVDYMIAKRSIEVSGRGIQTGVDLPQARTLVAAEAQKYEPAFRQVVGFQDRVLDYAQKAGLISAQDAANMRRLGLDYVPLHRAMDTNEMRKSAGAGLKVRDPMQRLEGSERQFVNPIESIVKNTHMIVGLAEHNRAVRSLVKLAGESPRGGEFLTRKSTTRSIEVTPDEVNKFLKSQGVPDQVADSMEIFRKTPFRPKDDEIAAFVDGKQQVYKAEPAIARAVNALSQEGLDTFTKLMAKPASWLRAGATTTPEFALRNIIRDQLSAFVFSKYGYVPVYDFIRNIGEVVGQKDIYQQWLRNGGGNATLTAIDRNYIRQDVSKLVEQSGGAKAMNIISKPIQGLRLLSDISEQVTRVGEFRRGLEAGASPAEAAMSSREVTLDFSRIGAKAQALNAIIPFWNAQVEGVDRAARAFKDNPLGTAAKIGMGITLPSMLLWYANKDDPRVQELPAWQKDFFWIVPTDNWKNISAADAQKIKSFTPKGEAAPWIRQDANGQWQRNDGNIYRIPKPFEMGVLGGSLLERLADKFATDHPNAMKDIGKSIMSGMLPNFVPQAVLPFMEHFANRSQFLDRPLVPKNLEGIAPKYQFDEKRTSEVAKNIGNAISKINADTSFASPLVIDNYIRQWTGGLGAHAVNALDEGLRATGIAPAKLGPEKDWADIPITKAFVARFPDSSVRSVQDFYEKYNELEREAKTGKFLAKRGTPEADMAQVNPLKPYYDALGRQHKLIRDLYRDKDMSPAQKREVMDNSYLMMIEAAKSGLKRAEQLKH
jgi:hypothetical protein